MKNISFKLICAITACSLIAALFAGGITLKRSSDYLTHEIEGKILNAAENYAHSFSSTFNHTEGLVDSLAAIASVTFDTEALSADPESYMDSYQEFLAQIVEEMLRESSIAHGLYVTFNPELSSRDDEVWYAYHEGEVERVRVKFEEHYRDFSNPERKDLLYFFAPLQSGSGSWVGPYLDMDISLNILSYSKPIYAGGVFLGVSGADITTEDTIDLIGKMKEYENGYAFLLDENLNFIVHPEYDASDNLTEIEDGAFSKTALKMLDSSSGLISYTLDGTERLTGFSRLDNGWTLAITQPTEEAFAPISTLNNIMMVIGITLFFLVILFAVLFSFVFFRPIAEKQDSLEAQNREKDILLAYQARQATMGEMVGNIAHQWKQPLNSINLILINLLDAYHYEELDEAKLKRSVDKVETIVQKLSDTIGDFTGFLKPTKEKTAFNVAEYIELALSLLEESIELNRISVDFNSNVLFMAYGYPNEFTHVIFNVLDNARDAFVENQPEDKIIRITLAGEGDSVHLAIMNTGSLIPEEILTEVFTPYFTTKDEQHGTGIGLYISKIIIERMQGEILLSNVEGGVCCNITLPAAKEV